MDQDEAPPYNPAAGDLHPALAAIPAAEEHQPWAVDAINKIQDHLTSTAIVDQAKAEGDKYVNDLAATKQNLLGLVQRDPTATPLALGLVDGFPVGSDLQDHFKNEIAHTAVQTYAGISRDAGHAALDRYGEHLTDDQQTELRGYTDNYDRLRQADTKAALLQHAKTMVANSNQAAVGHLSALVGDNGDVQFPPGWGQKMMSDMGLAPEAKAAMFKAYSNLQQNGDPASSDPGVMASMIQRLAAGYQNPDHPTPPEILGHAGDALTVADAKWLSSLSGPQPIATRDGLRHVSDALDQAETAIGNPAAYGRFVNWFLPRAQAGAVLDPNSKDYLLTPERMAQFRPTGDDLIAPAILARHSRSGPADWMIGERMDKLNVPEYTNRPSLDEIFGGRKSYEERGGDPVVRQDRPAPPVAMPRVHPDYPVIQQDRLRNDPVSRVKNI